MLSGYKGNWTGVQTPRSLRSLCCDLPDLDARGNYLCCRGKPLPGRERLPPCKENKKLLLVEVERRRHQEKKQRRGGELGPSVSMSPGPPVIRTTGSSGPALPWFPLA